MYKIIKIIFYTLRVHPTFCIMSFDMKPIASPLSPENTVEQEVLTPDDYGLPEIELVGMSRYAKNWHPAPLHTHTGCLEACFCRRGALNFECGGKTFPILPNNVFLSQPGDRHRLINKQKGFVCYWIVFRYPARGKQILGLPKAESDALIRRLRKVDQHAFAANPGILPLFKEIFAVCKTDKGPLRKLRTRTIFARLLLLLTDSANNRPTVGGLKGISDIARMIRHRPAHDYTIGEMAEHVHLSESRFIPLFRQVVGLPPHAFLIHCRLNEAQRRLRHTDDSVAKIAADLRFCSPQHLARHFTRVFGKSPTACRKHHSSDSYGLKTT